MWSQSSTSMTCGRCGSGMKRYSHCCFFAEREDDWLMESHCLKSEWKYDPIRITPANHTFFKTIINHLLSSTWCTYATSGLLTYEFPSSTHQWTQLKTRKQNLTRLFQKMQSYQFEQISADPDKPLADGIRPLDTADMERYVLITLEDWDWKYVLYSLSQLFFCPIQMYFIIFFL